MYKMYIFYTLIFADTIIYSLAIRRGLIKYSYNHRTTIAIILRKTQKW